MSITAHASSASPIFLDLTLRDVGYYNAWGFAPGLVSSYLRAKQDTKLYLGALLMKVYGEKTNERILLIADLGSRDTYTYSKRLHSSLILRFSL